MLTALQPVVEIFIAHCAQRFVVQAGGSGSGVQLFCKFMQGAQAVGGRGKLPATGAEKFLIAMIDQRGPLTRYDAGGVARAGHGAVSSA